MGISLLFGFYDFALLLFDKIFSMSVSLYLHLSLIKVFSIRTFLPNLTGCLKDENRISRESNSLMNRTH